MRVRTRWQNRPKVGKQVGGSIFLPPFPPPSSIIKGRREGGLGGEGGGRRRFTPPSSLSVQGGGGITKRIRIPKMNSFRTFLSIYWQYSTIQDDGTQWSGW